MCNKGGGGGPKSQKFCGRHLSIAPLEGVSVGMLSCYDAYLSLEAPLSDGGMRCKGQRGGSTLRGNAGIIPTFAASRHTSKLDAIMHVDSSFALTICVPVHKPQQDVLISCINVSTCLIYDF